MIPTNEREWLQLLLPLPHEIAIDEIITCPPGAVAVRTRDGAGPMEQQAAGELRQLLQNKGGTAAAKTEFEILLGTVDTGSELEDVDVERLRALPNSGQAYAISPRESGKLVLTGLEERGVFYAARTLYQLLEPAVTPQGTTIPLVRVLDWPDFDERGLWNFPDENEWIDWLSSVKLNYGKMANTRLEPVEPGRPNRAVIEAELMQQARLRAFNYVPYILHLNFLHDCNLFRAYPELAGRGDTALSGRYFAHKEGNQHRAPCASQPVLVEILAEWMESIAGQGGMEISCWLSERPAQCGCDACTAVGQFVLEARAFVSAWEQAQRVYPELQIRLFLSTTTVERDYRVLAELPPQVKVERACATSLEQILHWPRDLLANPLLDQCAAEGRWIASYDAPIGVNGKVDTPEFKLPERSAHRVRDFLAQLHRRRYSGAYGMIAWATLARETNGFNIEALAEWSWNLEGRSEEEFAVAWAVRQGFAHPEKVGHWAALMGPVEFDVYDSDFPVCYSQGKAVEMVKNRRRPYLGEGMFRYYLDEEDFARKRATCAEALEIAAELAETDFAHETRVAASYVDLAHGVYQVAEQLATAELESLENQAALLKALEQLEGAGQANTAAIRTWRSALGPEPWHPRVCDAIAATERTVAEIGRFVRERYIF